MQYDNTKLCQGEPYERNNKGNIWEMYKDNNKS